MTEYLVLNLMFVRASLYKRREENQLDATEWFIALKISSTYFGHLYDDPQELETVLVLLLHVACNALFAGGRRSGTEQQAWSAALLLTADQPDHQQPKHYTTHAVITQV